MSAPGFWDNPEGAKEVIQEANVRKVWVEEHRVLCREQKDLLELTSLAISDEDPACRTWRGMPNAWKSAWATLSSATSCPARTTNGTPS